MTSTKSEGGRFARFLKWLAERAGGAIVTGVMGILLVAATAAIAANWQPVRQWLLSQTLLSTWAIVLALAAVLSLCIASFFIGRWHERRKRRTFSPIVVHDARFNLHWRLTVDPVQWLHVDLRSMSPNYLCSLIAGPYHAVPECNDLLGVSDGGAMNQVFCFHCAEIVFEARGEYARHDMKMAALAELQRLHRNGRALRQFLQLANPHYWQEIDEWKQS